MSGGLFLVYDHYRRQLDSIQLDVILVNETSVDIVGLTLEVKDLVASKPVVEHFGVLKPGARCEWHYAVGDVDITGVKASSPHLVFSQGSFPCTRADRVFLHIRPDGNVVASFQ